MLDKIKKYAPKTHDALLKIITTNENAKLKIVDYEKRIQLLDKEIADLETKSIKDPSNSNLNDKLEELSAKRYGLMSRYESVKNGTINFISKSDVEKLLEVYSKEFKDKINVKQVEISHKYKAISDEHTEKLTALQEEFAKKHNENQSEDYALRDINDVLTQTITRYLLQCKLPIKEIETEMVKNNLPFTGKTERAL